MVVPLSFLPSSTPLYLFPTPFSKPHFLTRIHVRKTTSVSTTSTTSVSDSDPGLLFREKILYLENHLNVDSHKALQQNPNFRSADLSSLKSVEHCLSSMGLELSAVGRILDMYPQLLTADPHSDLYPIFDYLLNEVEIPFSDIRKSVIRCPRLLVSDLDSQLRPTLVFLRNFGFTGSSAISSHTTTLLVSSVELTLMPKINYLQSLGFSHKDVVNMVLRSPGLLTYSIPNNLVPKVEYFLKEMKGDLAELKRFPQYFSFSLEKKIKLRHRLLMEHRLSLPLSDMLKVSDGEFRAWLVEMRLQSIDRL